MDIEVCEKEIELEKKKRYYEKMKKVKERAGGRNNWAEEYGIREEVRWKRAASR